MSNHGIEIIEILQSSLSPNISFMVKEEENGDVLINTFYNIRMELAIIFSDYTIEASSSESGQVFKIKGIK